MRKTLILLIALSLLLSLAGCGRTRTGPAPEGSIVPDAKTETAQIEQEKTPPEETPKEAQTAPEEQPGELPPQPPEEEAPETEPPAEDPIEPESEEAQTPPEAPAEPPSETDENQPEDPDSERRQFDESASAQAAEDAEHSVSDGNGDPAASPEGEDGAPADAGSAEGSELTVTETLSAEEAEKAGIAEDAVIADSALYYYQTLLYTRLGDLFECKRYYVYCETPEDHVTVLRGSLEHDLISLAGAYSVSNKLGADAATVTDDWVVRKNPDVIIKLVGPELLGSQGSGTAAASALRSEICAREGYSGIGAVQNGRVIILSTELLQNEILQTAAAVYLAKALYPDSFTDTDPDEAMTQLTQEYYGSALTGSFILTE